ncbi:MAG: phosphoribosyltransferase [Armatimonadota bacterium]
MTDSIRAYSWNEMDALHRRLGEMLRADSYIPDVIVGIIRCGMVPAVHLAYILGVNSVCGIHVRTTPNDDVLVVKNMDPTVTVLVQPEIVSGRRLLMIDAVMASGTSMQLSTDALSLLGPAEIRTAILVDWPNSPYENKLGPRPQVDYVVSEASVWPDFPWEH